MVSRLAYGTRHALQIVNAKELITSLGLNAVLAFSLAFVLPWIFIAKDKNELLTLNMKSLMLYSVLLAFSMFSLGAVVALLRGSKYILLFALVWCCLSGSFFPLVKNGGMTDLLVSQTNWPNVAICGAASLIVAFFYYRDRAVNIFVNILFVIFLGSSVINLYHTHVSLEQIKNENLLSDIVAIDQKAHNFFVVSFDGLPGNVVNNVLRADASFEVGLKDFLFFPLVLTSSPATIASLMSEIYGARQFKFFGENAHEIIDGMLAGELVNNFSIFKNNDYDIYTYGPYSAIDRLRQTHQLKDETPFDASINETLAKIVFVRTASPALYRRVAQPLNALLAKINSKNVSSVPRHVGPDWDRHYALYVPSTFNKWINNLHSVEGDKPKAYFLHFTHTHFPVDFDETCRYRSDDQAWHIAQQNELGLRNQTKCAVSQFVAFIEKLKAIGAYDNATIVLKSDHGEPANYYTTGEHALKINNHPLWGYNRYRPTLMIKPAHQVQDKIVRSDAQVALSDLALTLCNDAKFKDCDRFDGVDIFGDLSPETFRDKKMFIYIPRDASSDFQIQSHKEIEISRSLPLLESLRATGDIKL